MTLTRRALLETLGLLGASGLAGCATQADTTDMPTNTGADTPDGATSVEVGIPQTGFTTPVPNGYLQTCEHAGTVAQFAYQTTDCNGSGEAISKVAYIYLPFGYSEDSARYDICYLMHGWGGHEGEYFEFKDDEVLEILLAMPAPPGPARLLLYVWCINARGSPFCIRIQKGLPLALSPCV